MPRRSSLSLALLLLPLISCAKVPATLPELEPEPARTEQRLFVEAQPEEPEPGGFAPISAEIAELYRCWFQKPYAYMFRARGHETLEVNGTHFGVLMAGIGGILHYGRLNACAGQLSGVQPRSYSDIGPIEALAGVPARLPTSQFNFSTVNPEFIAYARQHLLPAPDQTIDGVAVQLAYDRVFQRFFRLMGASLLMLLEDTDIDRETQQYLHDTGSGTDGIDWLEARYAQRLPEFPEAWDGTTMTAPMAAGFWLRRHADGSLAASWHGLREVFDRYDPSWLAEQKRRHPKAAAKLEQLPDPLAAQP